MIIYLRTPENKTLVDISVYGEDLHSVVPIKNYSEFLIRKMTTCKKENLDDKNHYKKEVIELINTFDDLQELRGWLWEYYIPLVNKNPNNEEIEKEVIKKLEPIAKKYGLHIVTD